MPPTSRIPSSILCQNISEKIRLREKGLGVCGVAIDRSIIANLSKSLCLKVAVTYQHTTYSYFQAYLRMAEKKILTTDPDSFKAEFKQLNPRQKNQAHEQQLGVCIDIPYPSSSLTHCHFLLDASLPAGRKGS